MCYENIVNITFLKNNFSLVQIKTSNNLHLGFIKNEKQEAYKTFHTCTTTALARHVYKDETVHDTSHTHTRQAFTIYESVIAAT